MEKNQKKSLPELLSPAGSPRALSAAIDAGADAVYFGASAFNARIGAENFTETELREAFETCHAYGVKAYVTLNTLALDREIGEVLRTAEKVWSLGADALIVADLGIASAIHRYYPDIELHASTQMSGHGADAGKLLSKLGFTRMVLARETSLENIKAFVENSPIEAEIFVHGALCVSHSGQCLFSSIVGGRSGNRGECAQPCRLPYEGKNKYPLSLRDFCLAPHVPAIIDSGVASLKIEGRMKSAEYVHEVTSVYRTLLDERRGANADELRHLSSVFSRGGFTDGYFVKSIGHSMLGIRSDADKENSRNIDSFDKIRLKRPISLSASFKSGEPSLLTLTSGERSVTVTGDAPFEAINAPLTKESALISLSKLGDTPFYLEDAEIDIEGNVMLPVSRLNALRRAAVTALIGSPVRELESKEYSAPQKGGKSDTLKSARFAFPDRITSRAREYFDRIYLPLDKYDGSTNGIIVPSVVFDSEKEEVKNLLFSAKSRGAEYALVGNLGHLALVNDIGLTPVGDFRLNVFNRESANALTDLGFEGFILSPELTLPQMRDIGGKRAAITYGRLPLMLLEKCAIKEFSSCEECAKGKATLTDRKGIVFPVLREYRHRNVIYNSLPTYMGDKKQLLDKFGISDRHFIFSTEVQNEVDMIIDAFEAGLPLPYPVRRIKE
ncbi:MAG: U32 family peptidase [Ruminococcaceae bacterium]|nr:U32 family peptidase [Oscillospiraceae bacterium]